MEGLHLFGEWYRCPDTLAELRDASALRAACLCCVEACGLTVVGECFHQFAPQGATGTVLLAESHLAIHTWPERNAVTIDVFVCNHTTDNSGKAGALFAALRAVLQPAVVNEQRIRRGAGNG